jgi:TIR domain
LTYLEIAGAMHYRQMIAEKIETCSVFVLIESRETANSEAVRQELHHAYKHRRGLVSVVIDQAVKDAFEYQIAGMVRLSFFSGAQDQNFGRLVETIKAYAPTRHLTPTSPTTVESTVVDPGRVKKQAFNLR